MTNIILQEKIENKILLIRNKKVMIDRDLADLYCVPTKRLNEQVKRNIKRFPEDFMFQLSEKELNNWKSQFATSNKEIMGMRKKPYAFTEQGVAMLSSVLNSEKAIEVNIAIMRVFVMVNRAFSSYKELVKKINQIKDEQIKQKKSVKEIVSTINFLLEIDRENKKNKKLIGFQIN